MIKSFLILISFSTLLFSSQQIILVVADDFNSSTAKLSCYEDANIICKDIKVNLGKNGLGWGLGEYKFPYDLTNEPLKFEGDKKAPAGIFKLTKIFGYQKNQNFKMPYLYTSDKLICVDDSLSSKYNTLVLAQGDEKSFEYMKRKDNLYALGIVVAHNQHATPKRGSCIFIHIQKGKNKGTAGCTSLSYENIQKITNWLDKDKHPLLIQIPKKYLPYVQSLYPQLKSVDR